MRGLTKTLAAVIAVEVVRLIARASDYLTGSTMSQGARYGDDMFLPYLWGGACLTAALIVVWGFIRNKPRIVINGAFLAAAISAMFAASIAKMTIFHMPPDDWRLFFDHLCTAAIWAIVGSSVAFRSGVWERRIQIEKTRRESESD